MAKITKDQWEKRINEVGAGRFEFIRWAVNGEFGAHKKCVIRCLIDGFEWSPTVNNIVNNGYGCPHCSGNRIWTDKERINQINSLENIEFVSWIGSYKNQYSKANVMCLVDNYVWSARVGNLVNGGQGCPQCAGNRRFTPEEYIEMVNASGRGRFCFSRWDGEFKNGKTKAIVKCLVDGFEWASYMNPLISMGCGCPVCAKSGYDPSKTGTLYALRSECGMHVKVGISNKPSQRHRKLERSTPFSFSCIEQISGDGFKISELEKHFHSNYERAGFTGFDGCTEWLICTPELLEELRNLGDKQ